MGEEAIDDALHQALEEPESRLPPPQPLPPALYIFDEPERHLHPTAQDEAARWISQLVSRGSQALIATHSLPFLALDAHDVRYFRTYRDLTGLTRSVEIGDDILTELSTRALEVGLTKTQLIQLTRGVLLVEGKQDELVLRHFFGGELGAARVEILPLRGADNVLSIPDLEFLSRLDIPLIVMLDNVRAEVIRASRPPKGRDRMEERLLQQLKFLVQGRRPPVNIVPFDLPDILYALPEEAVRRVVRVRWGSEFAGWEEMLRKLGNQSGAKEFLLGSLGISIRPGEFLEAVLAETPPETPVESPLRNAVQQVLALAARAAPDLRA